MHIKLILNWATLYLTLFTILFSYQTGAQTLNQGQDKIYIIYETNDGYHDLMNTEKTVFVKYRLSKEMLLTEFIENRRMILENFMAGVNFATPNSVLILEQFWNGIKVQQCIVNPSLKGAPEFSSGQNRPLDIRTQVKRENGPPEAVTLRNHSYWQTDFAGTTFFGQGDEFSWGNTTVNLTSEVVVEWKYVWSEPGNHFYFDHLKVMY
jgi:hypothetical protein